MLLKIFAAFLADFNYSSVLIHRGSVYRNSKEEAALVATEGNTIVVLLPLFGTYPPQENTFIQWIRKYLLTPKEILSIPLRIRLSVYNYSEPMLNVDCVYSLRIRIEFSMDAVQYVSCFSNSSNQTASFL